MAKNRSARFNLHIRPSIAKSKQPQGIYNAIGHFSNGCNQTLLFIIIFLQIILLDETKYSQLKCKACCSAYRYY